MKSILTVAFVAISILSSCQQTPETKKVHDHKKTTQKLDVKVVNEEDPICGMITAQFLKDTAVYKGKTYGFCNKLCKEEFKKNPKKYAK